MVTGNGISIRDYAKQHGISYEAVRKQVQRYNAELANHITTVGKKMYLDDVAVSFLDDRRQNNPVFISQQSESDQVNKLRLEIEALKNELMKTQKIVIDLQSENKKMIESQVKYDLLEASNNEKQTTIDALREDIKASRKETEEAREDAKIARQAVDAIRDQMDEAKRDADDARRERDAATEEAKSYRKSIFGFYRKTKK